MIQMMHSGDVIHTRTPIDTDADGDTLTVTQIKPSGGSNSAVSGTAYSSYSWLTLYWYIRSLNTWFRWFLYIVADQAAADALDAGLDVQVILNTFVYDVSDGSLERYSKSSLLLLLVLTILQQL